MNPIFAPWGPENPFFACPGPKWTQPDGEVPYMKKILTVSAMGMMLVAYPLFAGDYSSLEKETLEYMCKNGMIMNLENQDEDTKDAFCKCSIKEWDGKINFAKVVLTFMKLGNKDMKQSDSEAKPVLKPLMICGTKHEIFDN